LEEKATGAILWKDEYVGEGVCLGFNTLRQIYVVGSVREHGVGVRLVDLQYVDERTHRARISALNRESIEAFAAVPGPGLRYVAFVALKGNDVSLFVLDTSKDLIRMLGKAPPPPPLTAQERALVKDRPEVLGAGPWGWMESLRDSYMQLDPGIIQFEGDHVLTVSYGADTAFERSSSRNTRSWSLGPG
jgi:hypothetical protein